MLISVVAISNNGKADIPEHASWELLTQTFEEGHWVIDEACTGVGEQCIKNDTRTLVVNPI